MKHFTVIPTIVLTTILGMSCSERTYNTSSTDSANQTDNRTTPNGIDIAALAANEFYILDLVGELKPDHSTRKSIPIVTNNDALRATPVPVPNAEAGACEFAYGGANAATVTDIHDDPSTDVNEIGKRFNQSNWKIATWAVSQIHPNLCDNRRVVVGTATDTNAQIKRIEADNTNISIMYGFYQNYIRMSMRTYDYWKTVLGTTTPLYSKTDIQGPSSMILKNPKTPLELTRLNGMSSIKLKFSATLDFSYVEKRDLHYSRPVPATARTTYFDGKHGGGAKMGFTIQWRLTTPEFITCKTNDTVSCDNNGKLITYVTQLFDDRFEYFSVYAPTKGWTNPMIDPATGTPMYRQSLENFMTPAQKTAWFEQNKNPYKQVGTMFSIDHDMRPNIVETITSMRNNNVLPAKSWRKSADRSILCNVNAAGCVEETDDEYLSHYLINNGTIGFETGGLNSLLYTIHDFRIIGTRAN